MDVNGLALLWDANSPLRDRMRQHRKMNLHPVSQKWCEPTRANCITNSMVLLPALEKLKNTEKWKLPYLEKLQPEIAKFYEKMGIPIEETVIYKTANELKKLLGFVKRRAQRKEVTKACEFQKQMFYFPLKVLWFQSGTTINRASTGPIALLT